MYSQFLQRQYLTNEDLVVFTTPKSAPETAFSGKCSLSIILHSSLSPAAATFDKCRSGSIHYSKLSP
ncbi:hypothetical protein J6590_050795 [Homalodisca vitripennis]|nr:hypothetical protein J6590_050795 [Homalodisca vitripennis]